MINPIKLTLHLLRERRAVTSLEYALIAGLVALGMVTAGWNAGISLGSLFLKIAGYVNGA